MKADGADPNTRDIYGQTIMHEIAREWHADCAKFFSELSHDFPIFQKFQLRLVAIFILLIIMVEHHCMLLLLVTITTWLHFLSQMVLM